MFDLLLFLFFFEVFFLFGVDSIPVFLVFLESLLLFVLFCLVDVFGAGILLFGWLLRLGIWFLIAVEAFRVVDFVLGVFLDGFFEFIFLFGFDVFLVFVIITRGGLCRVTRVRVLVELFGFIFVFDFELRDH